MNTNENKGLIWNLLQSHGHFNKVDNTKFNEIQREFELIVNNIAKQNTNETILELNNVDISDWELIDYLLENNLEGQVVIDKKEIENSINYKYLEIKNGKYKIKNDIVQRYL